MRHCCCGSWWFSVCAPHAVAARCTVARSCKRPLCAPWESCAGWPGAQGRSSTVATRSRSILQAGTAGAFRDVHEQAVGRDAGRAR